MTPTAAEPRPDTGALSLTPETASHNHPVSMLGRILSNKGLVFLAIMGNLAWVSFELLEPQFIKYFIDTKLPQKNFSGWGAFFALWLALFLGKQAGRWTRFLCSAIATENAAASVRSELFESSLVHRQVPGDNNRAQAEQVLGLTKDVDDLKCLWVDAPMEVLFSLLTVTGALAISLALSWKLTVSVACVIGSLVLTGKLVARHLAQTAQQLRDRLADMSETGRRSIARLRIITAHAAQDVFARRMQSLLNDLRGSCIRLKVLETLSNTLGQTLEFCSVAGVLGLGGYLLAKGEISLGILLACIFYTTFLGEAIRNLSAQLPRISTALVAGRRLSAVLEQRSQVPDKAPLRETERALDKPLGTLALENICFTYSDGVPVLTDCSLSLQKGACHLVLGLNGVGKSTLLHILGGELRPTNGGRILANGVTLRDDIMHHYRPKTGILHQDELVLQETVELNLRLGCPHASPQDLANALVEAALVQEPAHAEAFLQRDAEGLSLGQKRRLAIARLRLWNPDLLLLDEPSANLDPDACRALFDYVRELSLDRLVVVTTQDLRLLEFPCERYILSRGRLQAMDNRFAESVAAELSGTP